MAELTKENFPKEHLLVVLDSRVSKEDRSKFPIFPPNFGNLRNFWTSELGESELSRGKERGCAQGPFIERDVRVGSTRQISRGVNIKSAAAAVGRRIVSIRSGGKSARVYTAEGRKVNIAGSTSSPPCHRPQVFTSDAYTRACRREENSLGVVDACTVFFLVVLSSLVAACVHASIALCQPRKTAKTASR